MHFPSRNLKNALYDLAFMQLIIPVAGLGSRLRPHTLTTAKPLMHVAGKTVLEHIFDRFKGLPITEVILITGHLKHQFDGYKAPWPVKTVEQMVMRGTADAINLTKELVHGPVIIAFSDTVFDADMSVIAKKDPDGILWAKEVEDYQRFGVIVHKDGIMTKIVEKPSEPISKLANIGLYYIKDHKALFDALDHVLKSPSGKGGEFFLTDAFQYLVDHGKKLRVEPVTGWYDTGTLDTTLDTNAELLKQNQRVQDFAGSARPPPPAPPPPSPAARREWSGSGRRWPPLRPVLDRSRCGWWSRPAAAAGRTSHGPAASRGIPPESARRQRPAPGGGRFRGGSKTPVSPPD